MSCELIAPNRQSILPGQDLIFVEASIPCTKGIVQFNADTGAVMLSGLNRTNVAPCGCRQPVNTNYLIDFGANIAISTGGTVGEISVGIVVGGLVVPSTIMRVTPAAVQEFFNVSRAKIVSIFRNCCQTVGIRNLSTQSIDAEGANMIIDLAK